MISMVEAGAAVAVNGSASGSKVEVNERGTMGSHIAKRLLELGIQDVFTVPGDYNLGLMDELLAFQPELRNIGCCNELNAGYAADGYARARGVAACVVTFTVGGLSVLNAIAGSYSENLPVICIVGGPNTNDYGSGRILHHTIGLPDFTQELRCFRTVTCYQAVVNDLDHAHAKIDAAITTALRESKPVYISISCNIANVQHSSFKEFVPYAPHPTTSNAESLAAAVEAAANFLNTKVKPVMVAGPNIRVAKAVPAFEALASASGYAVAAMAAAKGQISESQAHYIGTYLGSVSTPFCCEIIESADAYLFAGPVFNDYSSAGYSILIKSEKMVEVQPNRVTIANGATFGCVLMQDFLNALAAKVTYNSTAFDNRQRIITPEGQLPDSTKDPLRINILYKHIQTMLTDDTALIIETGDSWFNCMKLHLPDKCGYEFQMQFGSIGWSVGATLGYAQAATDKRVIACIGDGSFQMTAQEVSTMIRNGQKNIIFLINNGGYTSEAQIHDGTYNIIKNWNYTALIDAMHNNEGKCWTTRVQTEEELVEAIEAVGMKKDHLCFIEAVTNKDDTSVELLEWGARVASANGRAHVARQ